MPQSYIQTIFTPNNQRRSRAGQLNSFSLEVELKFDPTHAIRIAIFELSCPALCRRRKMNRKERTSVCIEQQQMIKIENVI
jgi:hypothetical protein